MYQRAQRLHPERGGAWEALTPVAARRRRGLPMTLIRAEESIRRRPARLETVRSGNGSNSRAPVR